MNFFDELFLVDLLTSRIDDRSHIFSNEVRIILLLCLL